ncbi:hypothetical protein [Rhodoferax sp.]|uniref:hypothetical protein n=1 Tax=Rhodoferax sp. TaxID=50421 RepID=UPI00262F552F|nr:hypothetical protein [Rhodoferax sp.]MDD2925864.1 hypothetical protein [Rhodoferax sp.]
MKQLWVVLVTCGVMAVPGHAQDPIYRCGNEYTNTKPDPRNKNCKLVEGGNVTVVQGTRVPKAPASKANPPGNGAATSGPRVNAEQQKTRDSDARLILESELKKAQARQEALKAEYNNGEPDKRGDEFRNHQKYLDRVAELKASLARNESDMAGIRRELERLPGKGDLPPAQK